LSTVTFYLIGTRLIHKLSTGPVSGTLPEFTIKCIFLPVGIVATTASP